MKLNDDQMRALWQAAAANNATDCWDESFFLRAGANQINASERTKLVAHMAECAACAEAYRVARAANVWAVEAVRELNPAPVLPLAPTASAGWHQRWAAKLLVPSLALAAALLLACVGLGVWMTRLARERQALQTRVETQQRELAQLPALREKLEAAQVVPAPSPTADAEQIAKLQAELQTLTQPQIEVPIIDVDPASLLRGRQAPVSVTRVVVPPSSALFTLILHLTQEPTARQLRLVWRETRTGKTLWQRSIHKGEAPNVTLTLARRNVPAGQYRAVLYAASGKTSEPLEQFDIEVSYPAKP